jgi:hypothetical protein
MEERIHSIADLLFFTMPAVLFFTTRDTKTRSPADASSRQRIDPAAYHFPNAAAAR